MSNNATPANVGSNDGLGISVGKRENDAMATFRAGRHLLYDQAALDAAVAAERERWAGALLLMRGRLLMENRHAVTTEAEELLLGPNVRANRPSGAAQE